MDEAFFPTKPLEERINDKLKNADKVRPQDLNRSGEGLEDESTQNFISDQQLMIPIG